MNFCLPKPDKLIEILDVSPGNLITLFESNDPHSNGMLRIEMKEKEEEEWLHGNPNLKIIFEFDMFSPDIEKKMFTTETQTIDRHNAYVAYSVEDERRLVKFTAIIDLDKTFYLYFNYYGRHYGDEQNNRIDYIQYILKTLQIKGNHQETAQQIIENKEQSIKERIRYHQKHYTTPQEQKKDIFHARYYPKVFIELQKKVEKNKVLCQYADGIYTNARLSIGFLPIQEDNYSNKGNTRFGGLPDFPLHFVWPSIYTDGYSVNEKAGKLCEFIAQINCAELKGLCDYFPERGMLYFFIDDHFWQQAHILYYDGSIEDIIAAKDLKIDLRKDVYTFSQNENYGIVPPKPAMVNIFPHVSILNSMDEEDEICEYPPAICKDIKRDQELNPYDAVDEFNEKMAKYPSEKLHAINADVYSDYFSPYIYASDSYDGDNRKPHDYVVLLRVAPDPTISNFNFRAESPIHFVIHKEKLKNCDFSQVYYGYQET